MKVKVELVLDYAAGVENWQERKLAALDRAKKDLSLIIPLVEDYYDARKPVGEVKVYEGVFDTENGVGEFLEGYMDACVRWPNSKLNIIR